MDEKIIDNSPELEALLVQNKQNSEDEQALLETIVVQGEKNNPTPSIQEGNETLKEISAKMDNNEKIVEAIKELKPEVQRVKIESDETNELAVQFFSMLRGKKGEDGRTPEKGVDYFTDKEIEQFKKDITPVKGKDYVDGEKGERGEDGKDGYTPIKGKDYFDGKDADEEAIANRVIEKIQPPKDGKDGKDGSPDTGAEIKKKLESLKKGSRLDYEALDNTPDIPKIVRMASRDYDLAELKDVDISNPSNNDTLIFNTSTGKWENGAGGGSGPMTALILEDPGAGTNTITVQAPTLSGNFTFTLPANDGNAGQLLRTDGSGILTWVDNVTSLTFVIDGGGSQIETGIKGDIEVPFACTISASRLLADQTGSIVVDIWKDTYANYPPTDADSITAAAPPTVSSSNKGQDTTLTGWTLTVNAGDILRFNVDSCSTITRCLLSLTVTKT